MEKAAWKKAEALRPSARAPYAAALRSNAPQTPELQQAHADLAKLARTRELRRGSGRAGDDPGG